MSDNVERREVSVPGHFQKNDLWSLFSLLRKLNAEQSLEIRVIVAFPESPSQGSFELKTDGRGNAGFFITLSAPADQEGWLRQILSFLD